MPQVKYYMDNGVPRSAKTNKPIKLNPESSRYCEVGKDCPVYAPKRVKRVRYGPAVPPELLAQWAAAAAEPQVAASGRRRRYY